MIRRRASSFLKGDAYLRTYRRFLSSTRHKRGPKQRQREQEGLVRPKTPVPVAPAVQPYDETPTTNNYQERRPRATQQRTTRQANRSYKEIQATLEAVQLRTHELKELSIGSFQKQDWKDAQKIMDYWCHAAIPASRQRRNSKNVRPDVPKYAWRDSVTYSLGLLERLVQEHQANETSMTASNNIEGDESRTTELQSLLHLGRDILQINWLEMVTRNWKFADKQQAIEQKIQKKKAEQPETMDVLLEPTTFLRKIESLAESSNLLRLNVRLYSMIMDVVIRQGIRSTKPQKLFEDDAEDYRAFVATPEMINAAESVEYLLQNMQKYNVTIDQYAYETIIQAWGLLCDGPRAYDCFVRMHNAYCNGDGLAKPNRNIFHRVLSALARGQKSADTISQCHHLLQLMKDLHSTDEELETKPTAKTYNLILTSTLHNPYVKDVIEQAERLFQEMKEMEDCFDKASYHLLMEMYSKRGMTDKVAKLLETMFETYQVTRNPKLQPDVKSFNIVMSAWTKVGNHGEVEALFQMMERLHSEGSLDNVAPDIVTYTILLENWAQQVGRVPNAKHRVGAIFQLMKRLSDRNNSFNRPSRVAYTTAINAMAKAGDMERAEVLLGEMIDQYLIHKVDELKPDLTTFNAVLMATSQSDHHDAVGRIQSLLRRMQDISSRGLLGRDVNVEPDLRSYNSLLLAMARSHRSQAGEECEKLLTDTMKSNPRLYPNTLSYTAVVSAYANARKATDAERVFELLCDEFYAQEAGNDEKSLDLKPSAQLFSSVVSAWSKSGDAKAPEKAEALVKRMRELSSAGDLDGGLDTVLYNSVLNCWATSGRVDAGNRAESILIEMGRDDSQVSPDVTSFNTVMNAFAEAGEALRCEELLKRMNDADLQPSAHTLCTILKAWSKSTTFANANGQAAFLLGKLNDLQESTGVQVNVAGYNIVLDCLAKEATEEAREAAEKLLLEMANSSCNNSVLPDNVSYTTLINAFSEVGDAEKAEEIMERMIQTYAIIDGHQNRIKPTTRCFNTVLKAWARKARLSHSPEAPQRAEALVNRMRSLHETSGLPVEPDILTYNILLDCLGRSNVPGSNSRALAVLQELTDTKNSDVVPNTVSYNTVLGALARSGKLTKVEELLDSMVSACQEQESIGGSPMAKPNRRSWNSLLIACAKSRCRDKLTKAESAIDRLEQLHSSGVQEALPNTVGFNCLMLCVMKSARHDSGERCEAILNKMEEKYSAGDKEVKPDHVSFDNAIQAWLKQDNYGRAESLLSKMCGAFSAGDRSLKPSRKTFEKLLVSAASGDRAETRKLMAAIYPDTQTDQVDGKDKDNRDEATERISGAKNAI